MERATGIGGVFLRAQDPKALQGWYEQHLGLQPEADGWVVFRWNERATQANAMLAQLRAAGATVDDKIEDSEYGKFGWATDPEGNRLELWQPPAEEA